MRPLADHTVRTPRVIEDEKYRLIVREKDGVLLYLLVAALSGGVLVADLVTPLGVPLFILYLAPLMLSMYTLRSLAPIVLATVASLLTIAGCFLSTAPPTPNLYFIAALGRGFGVLGLLGVALVGRQFMAAKVVATRLDWLRSGQNGLAARLQGEQTVAGLGRKVIAFLAEYLDAQVGAVYDTVTGLWREAVSP